MADRSGKQLGNYHLLRLLGKGGFAEVYLGEHIYLKTPVAVKLLHTQLENEDMTGFLTEAQMIARLQHAHIVRVTDFGMDGDLPYLVMDFAPNGTLRERHPRGTVLPLPSVTSYVKQVAEALQYAHDEKLIHRDIKPENMLLARTNSVLLSDFGIATVAHRTSTQNTSIIAGTAVYMSPELFRGKSYPASDQYALGVVVYEWLCGQPPFYEGDFIQLGYQHTYVPPDPLSEKASSISKDVEHIVNIALAKDPKQRFGSVQAFANALEQASQSKQGNVPPISPTPLSTPTPTPTPPIAVAIEEYKSPVERVSLTSNDNHAGHIMTCPRCGNMWDASKGPCTRCGLKIHVKSNNVVQPKPVTEIPVKKSEQANIWHIGKQQMIAALIGFAIVACLSIPLGLSVINSSAVGVGIVFMFLTALTPEFFGAVFGPPVGLFTGVSLFVTYITANNANSDFHNYFSFGQFFAAQLGFILIGFMSGFALLKTSGRYNIRRTLIFSSLGVLSGTALCALGLLIQTSGSDASYFLSDYLYPLLEIAFFYLAAGLILLPILRVLYYDISNRVRRA